MIVEARDDRNARPDDAAYALQQRAVRIGAMLGDHRAVQIEVDAVESVSELALEILEQHRGDALVRIARDAARRLGGAPEQRHAFVAQPAQLLHRSGRGQVDAGDRLEQRRPAREPRPGIGRDEIGVRREDVRERVGLVLNAAYRDARHTRLPADSLERCTGELHAFVGD